VLPAAVIAVLGGYVKWKDALQPLIMNPFGRQATFNISNCGRFNLPAMNGFAIQSVWFGVSSNIAGPIFGHNILTVNGKIDWTIVWYSPFTSRQRTEQLKSNIEKLLHAL